MAALNCFLKNKNDKIINNANDPRLNDSWSDEIDVVNIIAGNLVSLRSDSRKFK